MKKNAFLTFIFACIPGAGQMYYGYMKRGTSLLVYFCLFIMLGAIISPLVVGVAVVYMFSFFDTYDLIRYLVAGDPKPDEFFFEPDWMDKAIEDFKLLYPFNQFLNYTVDEYLGRV